MIRWFLLMALFGLQAKAQPSRYARTVIDELCSKKYFGRGYLKNGLEKAEKYLVRELSSAGVKPLHGQGYSQEFIQPVNTFPSRCRLSIDGKKLKAGTDFIPDPGCRPVRGRFALQKADSVTWRSTDGEFTLELKNKLVFSVSGKASAATVDVAKSSFPGTAEKAKVRIRSKMKTGFRSRNVIGYLPGSASDSMVVYTAHYDHLGGIGPGVFFPGANDNASGVSMVLNLARHYAKNPPRYKTLFVFFAGEEAGLLGSQHLVKSGLLDLGKIRFLINLDLLGTGDDGIMVVNGSLHESHFALLQQINSEKSLVKDIRKRGKAANSDHYHFSEAGVPAFFIYTLGGNTAYHDVKDLASTLPLTDYEDVLQLIISFTARL